MQENTINQTMYYQDDEREIDLRDLFAECIRRLPQAVICGIILAVLVGIGSFVYNNYFKGEPYSEEALEGILENLLPNEKNVVDELYNRYESYHERIAENQEYIGNSYLLNLDLKNVHTLEVQYSITARSAGVINSFTTMALSKSDYEQIAQVLGITNSKYVSEGAVFSVSDDQQGYDIAVDRESGSYTGGLYPDHTQVLSVEITGDTQEKCEIIRDVVDDAVMWYYQTLVENGTEITISKLGESYIEQSASEIADQRLAAIKTNSDLLAEYNTFEKTYLSNMNDEEKDYFDYLIHHDNYIEERSSIKKYIVVGGAIGFLLPLLWCLVSYLLTDSIKTVDEFKKLTGIRIFGLLVSNNKKANVFNELANKIAYGTANDTDWKESNAIVAMRLQQLCERENIHSVYVISDSRNKAQNDIVKILNEMMPDTEFSIGNPLKYSIDLEIFLKTDSVLLLSSLKQTRLASVTDSIALNDECNKSILGAVLLA